MDTCFDVSIRGILLPGMYPIHLAAQNGNIEIVRCLCLAGCKIDIKNRENQTPDVTALANGHPEIHELLKRLKSVWKTFLNHMFMSPSFRPRVNHVFISIFFDHVLTTCSFSSPFPKESSCEDYIEQLIPTAMPISKIKLKVFGDPAVGKTSLIESLKAGYFSGLFRR